MHRISDGEVLTRVKWVNASLRFDIALRNLGLALKAGFDPNEPRVPAGNPDGGQWTTGGGGGSIRISIDQPKPRGGGNGPSASFQPRPIPTDATRPQARPVQYTITESGRTGNPRIDATTDALKVALTKAMGKANFIPHSTGPVYGTAVHLFFRDSIVEADLPGVEVEQSFLGGEDADYGTLGSIRTDVLIRDGNRKIIAIYDLKTGGAKLSRSRADRLRQETNAGAVPVIELHFTRGASLKNGAVAAHFPAYSAAHARNGAVQAPFSHISDGARPSRFSP